MVALSVILFPPLLIAFLLIMERVEEPLRKPATAREVATFLRTANPARWTRSASSGIRRALSRWRDRRARRRTKNPPLVYGLPPDTGGAEATRSDERRLRRPAG